MPIISHFIPKEREGTYYTIPFDVPENVIKITVSYSYNRGPKGLLGDLKPTNTIDIGLANEKGRFLGWSGSAHDSIFVGEHDSSKGYLIGKVNPGKWRIIVGAYHVMDEGTTVTYNISFESEKEEDIFEAIKNGRTFITESVNGSILNFNYRDKTIGDTAEFKEGETLKIKAENLKGADLYIVTEDGEKLIQKHCRSFNGEVHICRSKFLYLLVKKGKNKLTRVSAITNPIYFI